MMISNVKGEFSGITGRIEFDPSNVAASGVEAVINAASVSTREPQRDRHLRSAAFLDVSRYPQLIFRSTSVAAPRDHSYEVTGELTIRGETRPVLLHVDSLTPEIKDTDGFLRRGASATARIDRREFGLMWNAVLESGGFVVGDDVEITIDLEMVRPASTH